MIKAFEELTTEEVIVIILLLCQVIESSVSVCGLWLLPSVFTHSDRPFTAIYHHHQFIIVIIYLFTKKLIK